ncbi:MAG TPA: mandelate racemase/muconate lactonizing enzyme family protein [Pirellulales bacterium]|nr:mandelate racemase/muconate lactonizing enzyme family protein [Pirellulales bacterium]
MNRRDLLLAAAGSLLATAARSADVLRDVRITRAVGFELSPRRAKLAGKNARLDVHGDRGHDRILRLFTNVGVEGLGNCRSTKEDAARLLGSNPFDFHQPAVRRMTGPLGAGTMPLWDLIGKVLEKPVFELLGGAGSRRVPSYDGSIYFADLLPQYSDRWQDRVREEIDEGLKRGHRAFKIKLGRGFRWMPRAEGDARDVEVVRLIRAHAGPDVLLGVDANNGYDLAGAKQLLERIGDADLAFVEELFPETVEECRQLKDFIKQHGWKTLVADGETQGDLEAFKPFMKAGAIDVFQGDMNRFGFDGILTEAAWAAEHGLRVAPHNWGSLVGFYMQLHVGRAISNFYRAEHDPLTSDVLVAEGYRIEGGLATVPDVPGCGLAIDEKAFAEEAKVLFDLKA